MPAQVAWVLIDPGWKVVTSDGAEIGRVEERVGDENVDIFDGLAISSSMFRLKKMYVPSEQVGEIYEGVVHLKITEEQVAQLKQFNEPSPSEQIEPENAPNPFVRALRRAFFLDRD